MRAVIQRVKSGKVIVDDQVLGEIGKGLVVLLGVKEGDSEKDAHLFARKIANLRIMSDKKGKMNLSVKDINGEVLVVSQFTLLADTRKGNRPSFVKAAKPEIAKKLYQRFIERLKEEGVKKVAAGEFGALMQVELINDGPVTIVLDTEELTGKSGTSLLLDSLKKVGFKGKKNLSLKVDNYLYTKRS